MYKNKEKVFSDPLMNINPKKIIHYYCDGGKNKDGINSSAFIRKGYGLKTKEKVVNTYRKSNTSTKAEALAIKLAVEDAIKNNFNPKNVVIYTDQKPFVFNNFNKSFSLLKELREVLESKGFCNFKYIRSTHSLDGIKPEYLNARTRNSYAVHKLAEENFTKINRYRRYQLKKKQNQKNKG